ncbi:hypothetical protein PPL_12319 [Heterostelium album PN500]|uniref:Uncharacterized protein n=1 Tax=Heterostelium pallidum (strain ATCC 26659 / Pp 5 / PN500) TaxID=670386 RepID=D3BMA9_HETP5|nr:hypothetical protein PPL_12319 [Heterostelium album PN500]EFA77710.1 hypothetical protein PPL_12319 [Heterostelium album PN500]|eukprot:XP_020429838.1 hypothetical protein PPL_12319 [Heterostelium album PN500]
MLPFIIQRNILSKLFNNNNNIFTLKEYIINNNNSSDKKIKRNNKRNNILDNNFKDLLSNDNNAQLSCCSLVCKQWFKLIATEYCTRYYIGIDIDWRYFDESDILSEDQIFSTVNPTYDIKILNNVNSMIKNQIRSSSNRLSSNHSIYQYSNINHLYYNSNFVNNHSIDNYQDNDNQYNQHQYLLNWLYKFTSLQRLTIKTECPYLVNDILDRFPHLKIELYVEQSPFYLYKDMLDMSDIDETTLEFVHLNVEGIHQMIAYDNPEKYYNQYVRQWRTNSFSFSYIGRDSEISHISYKNLLQLSLLESSRLRHIKIVNDYIDTKYLSLIVDSKSCIVSFKSKVAFGIYEMSHQYHGQHVGELFQWCSCLSTQSFSELYGRNRLEHWEQFCQLLANNKTLRRLSLTNVCKVHLLQQPETIESMSNQLSIALSNNNTLVSLTISGLFLTESFFDAIAHSNTTIQYLKIKDITTQQIHQLKEVSKHNKFIKINGSTCRINEASSSLLSSSSSSSSSILSKRLGDYSTTTFTIYVNQTSNFTEVLCGANMTSGCQTMNDALNSYYYQSSVITDATNVVIILNSGVYTGINNTNLSLSNINITFTTYDNNNNNNNNNSTTNSTNTNIETTIDLQSQSRFLDINSNSQQSQSVQTLVSINNLNIVNGAADDGAVIRTLGSEGTVYISINNSYIASNNANQYGGVFYFQQNSSPQLSVTNSILINNTARTHGAIIYSEQQVITSFYDCQLTYNQAVQGNGIIYAMNSSTVLQRCNISNNQVLQGSIIHTSDEVLGVAYTNFTGNRFTNATLYSENGYLHMSDTVFSENCCGSQIMLIGENGEVRAFNSLFTANQGSGEYPEVIRLQDQVISYITNSTFSDNQGGILYSDSILASTFEWCQFLDNQPIAVDTDNGQPYSIYVQDTRNLKFFDSYFRPNNSYIYCLTSQITMQSPINQTAPQILCGSDCLTIGEALCYGSSSYEPKKPRLTNADVGGIIFGTTMGVVGLGLLGVYLYRRFYRNPEEKFQYQPIA